MMINIKSQNAAFHRSKKIKELIESVGCRVVFLPPYLSDLNPIKKFWANMKKWIKQKIGVHKNCIIPFVHFLRHHNPTSITTDHSIYF